MRTKVVISAGGAPWMVDLARDLFGRLSPDVVGIIIEDSYSIKNKFRQLYGRLRRYGVWKTLDQVLLQMYLGVVRPKCFEKKMETHFACPLLRCQSINDVSVRVFLRNLDADFLVNIGSGIMRPETFETPKICTINIHPGIAPRYRGANPNLWALYEGRFDVVGVTVHKVDKGIDTGPILCREFLTVDPRESLEELTLRSYQEGINCVERIIKHYGQYGRLSEWNGPDLEKKTYGWYGLSHYLEVKRKLNRMANP